MGTLTHIGGITTLDIDPDQILKDAIGKLDVVLLIGYLKDEDEEYVCGSTSDLQKAIWMLERAKLHLLTLDKD